jgi:uncharacterized protein YegL
MAKNDFVADIPQNYEQKCLCVLVLDVSGSMAGERIQQLNRGLDEFHRQIRENYLVAQRLEICLITFSTYIHCIQEPALINQMVMPILKAQDTTRLVDALRFAMGKVEERKQWYRQTGQSYYRPFIFLITDGAPDDDQDIKGLTIEVNEAVNNRKFMFYPIGVQDADMQVLTQISHPSAPPMMLRGLQFIEFFKWVSNSVDILVKSNNGDKIKLPDISGWAELDV